MFFPLIQERYDSFSYENLTTLNYTDAVVNFNPTLLNSRIKSDYVLFEERPSGEYNHMGIAYDPTKERRYIETFFHEKSNSYILGQTIVSVKSMTIYEKNGNVMVTDNF